MFDFLDGITVQVNGTGVSSYDFGTSTTMPVSVTVTLVNNGIAPLNLGGLSAITVSGTDAADFSVSGSPSDTIDAGASTTFTLTFDATTFNQTRTATVTVQPAGNAKGATITVSGYYQLT